MAQATSIWRLAPVVVAQALYFFSNFFIFPITIASRFATDINTSIADIVFSTLQSF